MENKFIYAIRNKMRFQTPKGILSTEDLFDLSLIQLDSVYKGLMKQLKEKDEESLLTVQTKVDTDLQVAIDIIKYIVAEKQAAKLIAIEKAEKHNKSRLLADLIANKENEELANKSIDELKAMLAEIQE